MKTSSLSQSANPGSAGCVDSHWQYQQRCLWHAVEPQLNEIIQALDAGEKIVEVQ